MADIQWVQVVVGLVSGGAAGAIITALLTTYRNRIQPVRYRLELKELFGGVSAGPSAIVQVMLSDKGAVQAFSNLHQMTFDVSNRGNVDRDRFKFSLGFPSGTKIVMLEARDADRNHRFLSRTAVSPISPVDVLDFEVQPFNRGDLYEVTAYIADATDLSIAEIELTSPAPVAFVRSAATTELVAGLKPAVEIGLAGARLTFR